MVKQISAFLVIAIMAIALTAFHANSNGQSKSFDETFSKTEVTDKQDKTVAENNNGRFETEEERNVLIAYYTNGRADKEQADASIRPAISGGVENLEQYDSVRIGYPIWHGQAPRIISTFLESYDF